MKGLPLLLLLVISISACGPVHSNQVLNSEASRDIHKLAIQLKSDNEFEVYMDRATATNAAGAMFGLVGAAIDSSINLAGDNKKKEILLPRIQGLSHQVDVSDGLQEGLEHKQYLSLVEPADANNAADGILEMTIREWGLKITDKRHDSILTPFVQIKCVLRTVSGKKKLMDMVETYYGESGHSFHQYKNEDNLLKDDLQKVLYKAGHQIGTRLAYTVGGES